MCVSQILTRWAAILGSNRAGAGGQTLGVFSSHGLSLTICSRSSVRVAIFQSLDTTTTSSYVGPCSGSESRLRQCNGLLSSLNLGVQQRCVMDENKPTLHFRQLITTYITRFPEEKNSVIKLQMKTYYCGIFCTRLVYSSRNHRVKKKTPNQPDLRRDEEKNETRVNRASFSVASSKPKPSRPGLKVTHSSLSSLRARNARIANFPVLWRYSSQ